MTEEEYYKEGFKAIQNHDYNRAREHFNKIQEAYRQEAALLSEKIKITDSRLFMLYAFSLWFDKIKLNDSYDKDMGFVFFAYGLMLNNDYHSNENENQTTAKQLVDNVFEFFNKSRELQILCLMYSKDNQIYTNIKDTKEDVYNKYLIDRNVPKKHGIQIYDFQLDDFLTFLDSKIGNYILKNKGYKPSIIPKLYKRCMDIAKRYNGNLHDLVLHLLIYPFELLEKEDPEYIKYIESFLCNFKSNNQYLLPLDNNNAIEDKLFIKDKKEQLYISPFFFQIGLALGVKLLNKELASDQKYTECKSKYCENKVNEIVKKVFSNATVLYNVCYENIKGIKCELDTVVIYNNFVFCFESKSNYINDKAGSSIDKYYRKIENDFIEKACCQINNFYDVLKTNKDVIFYENDKPNANIKYTLKKIEEIIFVPFIATFEDFSYLSGRSDSLINTKNFNIIPILISVFDLEVVSKILTKEYEFINYFLQRIVSVNSYNTSCIESGTEEVLQLGFYLETINIPFFYTKHRDIKYFHTMQDLGDKIDEYFFYRLDRKITKPNINFDTFIVDIINWINNISQFDKSLKPFLIQWIILCFTRFKEASGINNYYEYINSEKKSEKISITDTSHKISYNIMDSRFSQHKKDKFLFCFTIHKNDKDNGEINKSAINKIYSENKDCIEFLGLSYNCSDTCKDDKRFNIFSVLPKVNPYWYFNINAEDII